MSLRRPTTSSVVADGAGVGVVRVDALAGVGADEQVVLGRRVVRRLLEHLLHALDALDVVGAVLGRHEHAGAAGDADEHGEPERRARRAGGAVGFRDTAGQATDGSPRDPGTSPSVGRRRPRSGGRRWTTSPASRRWVTAHASTTTRRPSGSTSVAVPSSDAAGQLDADAPAERAERVAVPRRRRRPAARRSAASSAREHVERVDAVAEPGRAVGAQPTLSPMPDDDRPGGVALGEDPGQLARRRRAGRSATSARRSTPATSRHGVDGGEADPPGQLARVRRARRGTGSTRAGWRPAGRPSAGRAGPARRSGGRRRARCGRAASAAVASRSAFVLPVSATCSTVQPGGQRPGVRWRRAIVHGHLHWQPCCRRS